MIEPTLKLVSHDLCPYVQRARIVLEEKSIPHQLEFVDLSAKPDWLIEISPLGKVPVLLVDGRPLFESSVIAEYLDEIGEGSLHPEDPLEKGRHRAWIELASATLGSIAALYNAPDRASFEAAAETLRQRFARVEIVLGEGPYFGGHSFSLVDAAFAPVFRYFDVLEREAGLVFFDHTPKVTDWRRVLSERPSVRRAAVPDYPARLRRFLAERGSHLSTLLAERDVA